MRQTHREPERADRGRPRVGLICLLAAVLSLTPLASGQSRLAERLQSLVDTSLDLRTASVGVSVRDVTNRRVLFERDAHEALLPASNMKLLTTGAALVALRPDFSFDTRLVLLEDGRLLIEGSGDPALGDPKLLDQADPPMVVDDLLEALTGAVTSAGVKRVTGIVVDDRVFDRSFAHPSWPADQLNRWYCAEVGGVNFHTNVLSLYLTAGRSGSSPLIETQPGAPWVEISNRARSIPTGRSTAWVARPRPENRFTLFGDVSERAAAAVDVAFHNPPLFTGTLIADRLRRAGVLVGPADATDIASPEVVRLAAEQDVFSGGRSLAVVRTALVDIIHRANTNSQNMYTEALIKAVGHHVTGEPGSWSNGGAVIRMLLAERLTADHAASTRIADGSGLSRENAVAPDTLASWLESIARDEELGPVLRDSMATPGKGTLRSRFRTHDLRTDVYAKSGTIRGVRCLSGYVVGRRTGHTVAFSVLINDLKHAGAERAALRLHEDLVDAIDDWLQIREASVVDAPSEPSASGAGSDFGG